MSNVGSQLFFVSEMEVPHFHISVDENALIGDAKKILAVFRPEWDLRATDFKVFTDGITNKLLGCFNAYHTNDVILIRVYGNKTDLLIDRNAETNNIKILHSAGLAPKLHGTFDNGLVYEYVPGEVLTTTTCELENVSNLVAKKLAHMHCVTTDIYVKEPVLWKVLKKFLSLVPDRFSDVEKEKRFLSLFPKKLELEKEYLFLEQNLLELDSPVVFCHNDLLLGNVIYNSISNTVTFIDYEYAAYNYQAYDIANHFNEYAGVQDVDYSLFPDEAYQKKWLKTYLKEFKNNSESGDVQISNEEVNILYLTVEKFTLASHFLWGVWCLLQAEYSSIDFDFLNYAFFRFREYFNRKKIIFSINF